jgi:hypothetical protein
MHRDRVVTYQGTACDAQGPCARGIIELRAMRRDRASSCVRRAGTDRRAGLTKTAYDAQRPSGRCLGTTCDAQGPSERCFKGLRAMHRDRASRCIMELRAMHRDRACAVLLLLRCCCCCCCCCCCRSCCWDRLARGLRQGTAFDAQGRIQDTNYIYIYLYIRQALGVWGLPNPKTNLHGKQDNQRTSDTDTSIYI